MARTIFVAHPSALLTDHRPHGDGLAAFNFVSRLAARGHRLHVVAENVELTGPIAGDVTIHRIPPRGRGRPDHQLATAWRIRRALDRVLAGERVDVVHQLNPVDVGLTCLLGRGAPPVVLGPYVPSWPRTGHALEQVKDIAHLCQQRRAAAVLLSTPAAGAKLRSRRPARHELGFGVDADVFRPADQPRAGREPLTVLFLANVQRRKGILDLLRAFAMVDLPACRLVVAGDGPDMAHARELAESLELGDRIEFSGRLDRAQAAEAMRQADLYCLPSHGEPFGISALEAMASGMPVVGTKAGGLGHLIRPEGGRAVAPGDPRALAEALIELLSDDELRRAMGGFNRELVERRYSWDAVVDELESVYDSLSAVS